MKKINPLNWKHKTAIEFLPTETLLGIKLINCEVMCEDDLYRQASGIEVGFIFFTILYVNISY